MATKRILGRISNAVIGACMICLFAGPSGVGATSATTEALDGDGTVYRLEAVPGDSPGTSSSLRLAVSRGDAPTEYFVVPGTEDNAGERWSQLSLSELDGTVTVVWEDVINALHSKIRLAQFRGDEGWVNTEEIPGSPWVKKSRPQFLVTADRADFAAEDSSPAGDGSATDEMVEAQVSHIVWREDQGQIFYANLVRGDQGASRVSQAISLNSLFEELEMHDSWAVDGPIALLPGRNQRSLVLGFVDPLQETVELLEISTLPLAVSRLADAAYETVSQAGDAGADLVAVSEEARSHIVFIGRNQPGLAPVLARAASSSIRSAADGSQGPNDWVSVAEEARSHIVFIGVRLDPDLDMDRPLAFTRSPLTASSPERHIDIALRHLASLPLPSGLPEHTQLLLDEKGGRALLYWQSTDGGSVSYIESVDAVLQPADDADPWGEVMHLSVDKAGSMEKAEKLVRARVRSGS